LLAIVVPTAIAVLVALRVSEWVRTSVRDGIAPYERFVGWSARGLSACTAWWDAATVGARNQALEARVRELETELTATRALRTDNAELRRQLDCARALPVHVTAEVLSHGGADGWSQRLRVSKGRDHGIRPNCPVLAPEGLVGRIVEATASTADVLLITDANSQVACGFDPDVPSARGILAGGGVRLAGPPALQLLHTLEPLRLAYLQKDLDVPAHARVVTSGLGGVYPRGIPVGIVAETEADASGLFQRSKVVPFVDFASLRYVAVLVGGAEPVTVRRGSR
jgi:rod shape-determining protein MreC